MEIDEKMEIDAIEVAAKLHTTCDASTMVN